MAAQPRRQEVAATGSTARRSGRLRRAVLGFGICLVVLMTAVTAGTYILLRRYDSAVARGDLLAPNSRAEGGQQQLSLAGPMNFLLIGSDYRTWSPSNGERSDTIIVAHVTRAMDRVFLVSIPRDLLVTIPPSPDLSYGGGPAKINAAFEFGGGGVGGIQLLSQTLTQLTGVRFDGAAVIQFDGLKKAVDVLGGVEMCVDTPVTSIHTGRVFAQGCRLMNSTEVLDYLRQRYFKDGDYGRQRHQQQFLKSFFNRATSSGVLSDPGRLDALLRAVGSSMTVDTGALALPDLVYALRDIGASDLSGVKVPAHNQTWAKQAVLVPTADAQTLFSALRDDQLSSWATQHPQWVNAI